MDVGDEREEAQSMSDAKRLNPRRRLHSLEVETGFVQAVIDLKEIHVFDGMDQIPDSPGFRIRCRDLFGPLPDAVITDIGDRFQMLDKIATEAAKLLEMIHTRQEIEKLFPRCSFLLPTSVEGNKVVGIRIGRWTVLAEAKTFWEASHELERKVTA